MDEIESKRFILRGVLGTIDTFGSLIVVHLPQVRNFAETNLGNPNALIVIPVSLAVVTLLITAGKLFFHDIPSVN